MHLKNQNLFKLRPTIIHQTFKIQQSNVTKLQTFDTLIQQLYQCSLCILVGLHALQNKQFSSSKQNTIQK